MLKKAVYCALPALMISSVAAAGEVPSPTRPPLRLNTTDVRIRYQQDLPMPGREQIRLNHVATIMKDISFTEELKAAPVSDDKYNVPDGIKGVLKNKKGEVIVARVPLRLHGLMWNTEACDINYIGGCLVVEVGHDGRANAFYIGTSSPLTDPFDSKVDMVIYRQEVDMKKHSQMVSELLAGEVNVMTVYSQAENQDEVIEAKKWIAYATDDVISGNGKVLEREARERAQLEALRAAEAYEQDMFTLQEAARTGVEIDASLIDRYRDLIVQTIPPTPEWKAYLDKNGTGMFGTCHAQGYMDTLRPIWVVGIRPFFKKGGKLLRQGKGVIECYIPGGTVKRINVEFRQSYKFIAGAKVEMGREYFRSGGIGFTSGVLDLVLTKNRDAGTVTLCSDYNFPFANVDVGLGPVGAGFSLGAPGPTKSGPAITMRASGKLGILGVSFGAISADKICVDPETFQ